MYTAPYYNGSTGINDLLRKIHTGYYVTTGQLCDNLKTLIKEIRSESTDVINDNYIIVSERIVNTAKIFIDLRTLTFIPFIASIKKETDHNCDTCSGNCELQHTEQLIAFSLQARQFRAHMNDLLKASSKIYKRDDRHYKKLHDKISLLQIMIVELLYMEDDSLRTVSKPASQICLVNDVDHRHN